MNQPEPSEHQVHPKPKAPAASGKARGHTQPFSEHLHELRVRLIISVLALLTGSIIGYALHEQLFAIITKPLNEQLYYTSPTGGFNAVIKISIMFGILIATPVFIYQLGRFLRPAFRRHIKAVRIMLYSTGLAILGVLFAYYVALPAALHFLANIDENLEALITVNEYINFMGVYLVGFAILFQLPLILVFINRIKPQSPGGLMGVQRWVILVSFILAAILTPTPDPVNLLLMALPIILLYQFSIVLIWNINRRDKKKAGKIQPAQTVPVVPEPAQSRYSQTAYSTAMPFPSDQTKVPPDSAGQKPKIIADIFAVPDAPA